MGAFPQCTTTANSVSGGINRTQHIHALMEESGLTTIVFDGARRFFLSDTHVIKSPIYGALLRVLNRRVYPFRRVVCAHVCVCVCV